MCKKKFCVVFEKCSLFFKPRAHEAGGTYGNGVIVRRYRTNSLIPVRVQLTANHFGYFEFRVCPMTYQGKEVDQECLDKNLLLDENGNSKYYPGAGNRDFEVYLQLPEDLTCIQCVFQWRYVAGNNWGECGNGTGWDTFSFIFLLTLIISVRIWTSFESISFICVNFEEFVLV